MSPRLHGIEVSVPFDRFCYSTGQGEDSLLCRAYVLRQALEEYGMDVSQVGEPEALLLIQLLLCTCMGGPEKTTYAKESRIHSNNVPHSSTDEKIEMYLSIHRTMYPVYIKCLSNHITCLPHRLLAHISKSRRDILNMHSRIVSA
jgi:hypothetical protein